MWFAGHCSSWSKREEYVRELSRYIDVDIYGECGNLTCGYPQYYKGVREDNCTKQSVSKDYRFYLALENSFCEEYVTEKLVDTYVNSIESVPIVMGLINYKRLLPDHSFIDVIDYESPEKLARFLHRMAMNHTLYNMYMRNVMSVDAISSFGSYQCRLCKYLHKHRGETQIVPDVVKYWSSETRCLTSSQYWHRYSRELQ